jgi:addiction module RelE/StbE family toxin
VKKLKLVWTNEALNRLSEIDDFISQDSVSRARKFINELINSASSIPQYPQKGRIVPEFDLIDIRELIHKNYRIVYRMKEDQIQILTVFEAHRLIRATEIFNK